MRVCKKCGKIVSEKKWMRHVLWRCGVYRDHIRNIPNDMLDNGHAKPNKGMTVKKFREVKK